MKRFASKNEQLLRPIAPTGARKRIGKFVGLLLPGLVFMAMAAGGTPAAAASKAQAKLQVSATILTMIKINVVSQPRQISIDQKHVSQGYIDIEDGSVLLITTNSPDGFMMSLSHDPVIVSRVAARLSLGGPFDEADMIFIRTPETKEAQTHVSYRLYLNPQARAGNWPWPVALSFTPRAV